MPHHTSSHPPPPKARLRYSRLMAADLILAQGFPQGGRRKSPEPVPARGAGVAHLRKPEAGLFSSGGELGVPGRVQPR